MAQERWTGLFKYHARQIHFDLMQHVVQIVYTYVSDDANASASDSESLAISVKTAFLIEIADQWFMCTAGHVFDEMQRETEGGRLLRHLGISYGFQTTRVSHRELEQGPNPIIHLLYDEPTCTDVGFISLTPADRLALSTAGCSAFRDDEAPVPDPHLFVALGFPKHNRDIVPSQVADGVQASVAQWFPMLPLEAVRDADHQTGLAAMDRKPQFVARVLGRHGVLDGEDVVLVDSNGMSGGPIVSLRLGEQGYWCALVAMVCWERVEQSLIGGNYRGLLFDYIRNARCS
jgi:hypothetical protein